MTYELIYILCKIIGWYRMAAASVVTVLTFVTSLIGILFFVKRKLIILRVRVFVCFFLFEVACDNCRYAKST